MVQDRYLQPELRALSGARAEVTCTAHVLNAQNMLWMPSDWCRAMHIQISTADRHNSNYICAHQAMTAA